MTAGRLRVLVVDDEPLARDCLRLPLAARADVDVVGECGDGASAVERIVADAPDLVFLDVQMPDLDGFEVVARVGADRMPGLIFVTAHGRHAVRAFEVHALNYLMKPFTTARLYAALEHARSRLGRWQDDETPARLARLRDEPPFAAGGAGAAGAARPVTRLLVREGERFRFVRAADVLWFEACRNHVRAHLAGSSHLVATPLGALAARLDPERFVRCHRSSVVNLDAVREVQPWFGGDYVAILVDGRQVRVSRTHREALLRPWRLRERLRRRRLRHRGLRRGRLRQLTRPGPRRRRLAPGRPRPERRPGSFCPLAASKGARRSRRGAGRRAPSQLLGA